jgi:hypothetical protein
MATMLWKTLFISKEIDTNPVDFITLSLQAMVELQSANKPNILYKLAFCIGTKQPGSNTTLFPMYRMPFGLVQYQIDFFSCTNISQISYTQRFTQ